MCLYVTRQLDKWVIWNHENGSFNWILKGKKTKNITESHIMLKKIQVLQLYAFIQSRFHSDTPWEKESKNAVWGLVHSGLLNWLVGFVNWSHQLNQLTEWPLHCVHSVKLIPSSNPNVLLFVFWKSEWRDWVIGVISWTGGLFWCTYREWTLRVTRPVQDAPEHSISLEGFCCHLPPVLLPLSSHRCYRKTYDGSPPGSSVHGILQARMLEWVAMTFSRGSSWPRDWTWVSYIAGRFFTIWATREAPKDTFTLGCHSLPGDLPNPGIKPGSPALQADSLSSEPLGKHKGLAFPLSWGIEPQSPAWQAGILTTKLTRAY